MAFIQYHKCVPIYFVILSILLPECWNCFFLTPFTNYFKQGTGLRCLMEKTVSKKTLLQCRFKNEGAPGRGVQNDNPVFPPSLLCACLFNEIFVNFNNEYL
jgi:hypothetical protein